MDLTSNTIYDFCVCTFNKNFYMTGRKNENDSVSQKSYCLKLYDIKNYKWS